MDVLLLMIIFCLYPGRKIFLSKIVFRKTFFWVHISVGVSRLSLFEMDKNLKMGGTIGYCDSYLEFAFRRFNVFRLHAKLNDAAEAVRAHSDNGPGYGNIIGRGPNSWLLGHVTGLFFCLYVKLFLPSILNSVDFWSSIFGIDLDIEQI